MIELKSPNDTRSTSNMSSYNYVSSGFKKFSQVQEAPAVVEVALKERRQSGSFMKKKLNIDIP
jgi:hypothetical protein